MKSKKKYFRRIVSALLALTLVLGLIPFGAVGAFAADTMSDVEFINAVERRNSVPKDYIGVYTPEDLKGIKDYNKYILMNDIDMSACTDWITLDFVEIVLDGNGYAIKNFTSNDGLFSQLSYSRVYNLGLENVNIDSSNTSATGALANSAYGVVIDNCYVTGAVKGFNRVGGLVGDLSSAAINYESTVKNCFNAADVSGVGRMGYSSDCAGGISGYAVGNISRCYNVGNIIGDNNVGGIVGQFFGAYEGAANIDLTYNSGTVKGKEFVGGICGFQTDEYKTTTISNTYNMAEITGEYSVGGIVGKSMSNVLTSYNTGNIYGDGENEGIVGTSSQTNREGVMRYANIVDCYYLDTIVSDETNDDCGAQAKSYSEMQTFAAYSGFDGMLWEISPDVNEGFPYIKPIIEENHYSEIRINRKSVPLKINGTIDLFVKGKPGNDVIDAINWSTSNPVVASVDGNGKVTAVGAGEAVITAETSDGRLSADCIVKVKGDKDDTHKFVVAVEQKNTVPEGFIGVYTPDDLAAIESGNKYILMNDIDLSVYENWEAKQANNITLDGNGYAVKNMTTYSGGLFKDLFYSSISNLALLNVRVTNGKSRSMYAAGIAGEGGNLTIDNCFVTGKILGVRANSAGFIAWNYGDISVNNSYNAAKVSGFGYVGGILGFANGNDTIKNSYNLGDISAEPYAGGIVGLTSRGMELDSCYNKGNISGSQAAGGIAGSASDEGYEGEENNCIISNSYNEGTVYAPEYEMFSAALCGGIVGIMGNGVIDNCTNYGEVNGRSIVGVVESELMTASRSLKSARSVGTTISNCCYLDTQKADPHGEPKTAEELKSKAAYPNYDFENVWAIDPDKNNGYPYHKELSVSHEKKPEVKVELNMTEAVIGEGGKIQLTVSFKSDIGYEESVEWLSSDPEVATVDANGNVTANKAGEAVIAAVTSDGEYSGDCLVIVEESVAPSAITLSQSEATLKVGGKFTLTATVTPDNAFDKSVTWTSSNPDVASVDENGNVVAKRAGTAVITATTANGLTASCEVTVENIAAESIVLSQSEATLKVGGKFTLTATVTPDNAFDKSVTWSSSNPDVAAVDENGNVAAKKAGTAVITATTANGLTATCEVTVENIVAESIVLSQTEATLKFGGKFTLTATVAPDNAFDKSVTWSSSNPDVAAVDENGNVTAKKTGTAVITATTANGLTATCEVTVENIAAESIVLSQSEATLKVGGKFTLTATVTPDNAFDKSVTWSSSNPDVAAVDENGNVTAKKAGTAVITATTANGLTATCEVTVENIEAEGIVLSQTEATLKVGGKFTLTATVTPDNAFDKSVTWTSSNPDVAAVDENGNVVAKRAGIAVITAITANGLTATCEVTVEAATLKIVSGGADTGEVFYVKLPSIWMQYKSHYTTLGFVLDSDAEIASVKWSYANWSTGNPEANIESPDSPVTVIRPNGRGIGARSTWITLTVTDVYGNVYQDTVKVRFYKWSWQVH